MKSVELNPIEKLMVGVNKVADAVGGTLGATGRNVFLDVMPPRITNDGKTIADSIDLEDRLENLGAWLIKNAAAQTNDDVGDGTTTTTILTAEIIKEALKRPENAMDISRSLKSSLPGILASIREGSREVTDVKEVALISAEHEDLAEKIAALITEVGPDGTIRVEENNEPVISYEVVDGYEANAGYMSPHFVNTDHGTAEFDDAPVFCSQKKISTIGDISRLFEQLKEAKATRLVIVADDIDPEILGVFVMNKKMGLLNISVIKASGTLLEDIATTTGATLVGDSGGVNFDNFDFALHMGQAKVISTDKKTIFQSKAPTAKVEADRLDELAKMSTNKFEANRLHERAAKLRKGVAILRVGSSSTVEMAYLKDKADDAIHATQAAMQEGVVEGGGMCLWRIAQGMHTDTIGEEILKRALCAPLKRICENSGKDYADIVGRFGLDDGYNAKYDTVTNLFDAGIVDPAKVERVAITNALLNAAQFITTHAAIIEVKEAKV